MSFPHWTQTVSNGTKSSTVFRNIVTNYSKMQSCLRKAMLPYGSLEGLLRSLLTSQGAVVTGALLHDDLSNITASQHHSKLHGNSHIASDAINLAGTAVAGLMSTTQYKKIYNINTGANWRPIRCSKYVGTYDFLENATQAINIGWQPRYIKIFKNTTATPRMFEIVNGCSSAIKHQSSTYGHPALLGASFFIITTNGFKVKWELNSIGITYNYIAMR